MNKKIYLLASVIVLILIILFVASLRKDYLVEKYYPSKGCDLIGSSIEATNQECKCSGFKISKEIIGLTKSICIGKRTDFKCWNRNNNDRSKQIVECD